MGYYKVGLHLGLGLLIGKGGRWGGGYRKFSALDLPRSAIPAIAALLYFMTNLLK